MVIVPVVFYGSLFSFNNLFSTFPPNSCFLLSTLNSWGIPSVSCSCGYLLQSSVTLQSQTICNSLVEVTRALTDNAPSKASLGHALSLCQPLLSPGKGKLFESKTHRASNSTSPDTVTSHYVLGACWGNVLPFLVFLSSYPLCCFCLTHISNTALNESRGRYNLTTYFKNHMCLEAYIVSFFLVIKIIYVPRR